MIFLEIVAAVLFVLSSGLLFNERFRSNPFLVGAAALIAIVSSFLLMNQIIAYFSPPSVSPATARSVETSDNGLASVDPAPRPSKATVDAPSSDDAQEGVERAIGPPAAHSSPRTMRPSPEAAVAAAPRDLAGSVWHDPEGIYDIAFLRTRRLGHQGKGDWEDYGTWGQDGSSVTITYNSGSAASGDLQGDTLVLRGPSGTARLKRIGCSQTAGGACPSTNELPRYD